MTSRYLVTPQERLSGLRMVFGGALTVVGVVTCSLIFGLEPDGYFASWVPNVLLAALVGPMVILMGVTVLRRRFRILSAVVTILLSGCLATYANYRVRTFTARYSLYGISFCLVEAQKDDVVALKSSMTKAEIVRLFGPCLYPQGYDADLTLSRIDVAQRSQNSLDVEWVYFKAAHAQSDLPFHLASAYWQMKLRWVELEADHSRRMADPKNMSLIGADGQRYPFTWEGVIQKFADDLRPHCDDPDQILQGLAARDSNEHLRATLSSYLQAHQR